ncbi:unnamed protein product [Cylicocyclus nassatus]|uniref:Acyltransferase 3 domain-containing protein n=1 Tax=Cylicocyclus nassatus TaxID=53992 RepID=A0AA36MBM6_CYLNA|nr:unnamed protein product [Cylicocyclus nassatus]
MLLSQQTTAEGYDLRKSENSKRRDLQGLRGIAILFVLVMHLRPNFYRLGFVGVDIFFVLSGYLMARILLRKNFTMDSVFVFYCRRFKRIVPLYMVTVLSIYMYGYFYIFRIDRKQIFDDLVWACAYTSNLQPIFQKVGYWDQLSAYRFFMHTWSLGVELQYYLIVPLLMGIASCCKHKIRLVFFLSLVASSAFFQLCSPPNISYGFLLSRIWQFMCGSIAYEFSRQDSPDAVHEYKLLLDQDCGEQKTRAVDRASETNLRIKSLVTYIWLVALVVAVLISPKRISDDTARVCATFMAGIIIYLNANVFCLTNNYLVYCGDISYVLYLVHWPIIVAVRYCWDSQTLSVTGVLIVVFVSFTISVAAHHTLEDYFMKKGVVPALICVIACYVCILGSKQIYLHAPPLESINPNTSKIEYAIEWNIREFSRRIDLPCGEDDTEGYAKFSGGSQWRCVAVSIAGAEYQGQNGQKGGEGQELSIHYLIMCQ